jgi:hypothetical protein
MKREYIKNWILTALKPIKNVNKEAPSSYGLKHICEGSIGVYVSNEEIIDAMIDAGFIHDTELNCYFNISKTINDVVFKEKLGNNYSNEYRDFSVKSKKIFI